MLQDNKWPEPSHLHSTAIFGFVIQTYYIAVSKYKQVCMKMRNTTLCKVVDGPLPQGRVIQSAVNMCLTTFQGLLMCQKNMIKKKGDNFSSSITYQGTDKLSFSHFQEQHEISVLSVPEIHHCQSVETLHCVIQLEVSQHLYVNLTILNMTFSGMSTEDCKFGGFTVYEGKEHILDTCVDYGTDRPPRNIYSTQHSMKLVAYSYFTMSSVYLMLKLSTTQCKPLRLNICKLHFACNHYLPSYIKETCTQIMDSLSDNGHIQFSPHPSEPNSQFALVSLSKHSCGILQISTDFFQTSCRLTRDDCTVHFVPNFVKAE